MIFLLIITKSITNIYHKRTKKINCLPQQINLSNFRKQGAIFRAQRIENQIILKDTKDKYSFKNQL